jgi:metal-responsive CopG/Arc/MetJ family transcriptional regulator
LIDVQKIIEKEAIVPVRFPKHELQKIDEAAKRVGAKSRSAFIREATEKYVQEVGGLKVIEIRENVSMEEARTEILTYLSEHNEAETFDIANDLRLDLDLTVKVLKKLWEEGKVS